MRALLHAGAEEALASLRETVEGLLTDGELETEIGNQLGLGHNEEDSALSATSGAEAFARGSNASVENYGPGKVPHPRNREAWDTPSPEAWLVHTRELRIPLAVVTDPPSPTDEPRGELPSFLDGPGIEAASKLVRWPLDTVWDDVRDVVVSLDATAQWSNLDLVTDELLEVLRKRADDAAVLLSMAPVGLPEETQEWLIARARVAIYLLTAHAQLSAVLQLAARDEKAAKKALEQTRRSAAQPLRTLVESDDDSRRQRTQENELICRQAEAGDADAIAACRAYVQWFSETRLGGRLSDISTFPRTLSYAQLALRRNPGSPDVPGVESGESGPHDADEEALEEAMAELNALIGLSAVKAQVERVADLLRVQRARQEQGLQVSAMSQHLVFTGSPGTGKTTVARLVARIYKALGLLSRGHLRESARQDLVAEYVGQTAVKTDAVINEALGGVLFIDEAYALAPADADRDFGREAIETLLKRMEDARDSFVVIVAGYQNEMRRFLESNPGLESRFGETIDFPDYEPAELMEIFHSFCEQSGYELAEGVEALVAEKLREAWEQRGDKFGNARTVRNFFEDAIANQASRIADMDLTDRDLLIRLKATDIPEAVD